MLDLIAIGDVTEDVFVQVTPATHVALRCQHDQIQCELCFPFGTKLAIERVDKLIGGNAGNVAIGSRRLGLKSALYAEVGNDDQGQKIVQSLKNDKVSIKYFSLKKGEKTNYSVVLNYNAERTILVHHEVRHYHFPKIEQAQWLYFTSMGKGSEMLFTPLLQYLQKAKANFAFNPGTHQLNLGLKKLKPLLQQCTVVFLNTEETQLLLETKVRDFRYLLRKLQETGPNIAVVTDGNNGSYCFDGKNYWYCPIFKVPVLEMTGSGDSFATGFVCALFYEKTIAEALCWGSINAASVIQKIGPQEGLISLTLLKKILVANPKFKARKLNKKEVMRNKVYRPQNFKSF